MPCPFQWLVITDGTFSDAGIRNQVDLISPAGFCVLEDGDWRPTITMPKGGGVWKDSQLADGRRPADFKAQNVIETMTLTLSALDQDALIRDTQELRRLLGKARTYGTTEWQAEPVWIEAQSPGESEMRYAIVWDWGTPNDGNPYEEPFFQTVARAGMDDFTLTLEREPYWRHVAPGSSDCVELAGYADYCWPYYLEYDNVADRVVVPANAATQDLPDSGVTAGTLTAECWLRFDPADLTLVTARYIFAKNGMGVGGWSLSINDLGGGVFRFFGFIEFGPAGRCWSNLVPTDGEWHHLAMTWDDARVGADRYPRLWLDGVLDVFNTAAAAGAYVSDAGLPLYIGNSGALNRAMVWDIGWSRVSGTVLYAAPFVPPARCFLPADVPGVTIGQWIGAENNGTTIDNQEGTAALDGTTTGIEFDCDCAHTYGTVDDAEVIIPTCLDEVFVANKVSNANITHVFTWSNLNGFSANLVVAGPPYALVDTGGAAPQVNDYVVFGVEGTPPNGGGPFCSLVFDIGTTIVNCVMDDWEYSTGGPGWANLAAEQDNTNQGGIGGGSAFDTLGVGSVHWEQPAAWLPQVENGITGYWIRVLVSAVPGGVTAPIQQSRDVYTVTWASVEIEADQVEGDVAALLETMIRTVSGSTTLPLSPLRALMGLRSLSRGEDFSAYINLSDAPLPIITVDAIAYNFINYVLAPTGRAYSATPPGAIVLENYVRLVLSPTTGYQYIGRYHAFLRCIQTGGAGDNFTLYLNTGVHTAAMGPLLIWTSRGVVVPAPTNDFYLLDFGTISLPPIGHVLPDEQIDSVAITISGSSAAGAPNVLNLIDLILLPIDEMAIDAYYPLPTGAAGGPQMNMTYTRYLDLDSVTNPKTRVRSLLRNRTTDEVLLSYIPITSASLSLQANSDQRLWFLAWIDPDDTTNADNSYHFVTHTIRANNVHQYYSMRGNR